MRRDDREQMKLTLVVTVALQVLANLNGLLDQVVEILRDLRSKTCVEEAGERGREEGARREREVKSVLVSRLDQSLPLG